MQGSTSSGKLLFLIQARLGSSRFPSKVLTPVVRTTTLLEMVYLRVLRSEYATPANTLVLTSSAPADDRLAAWLMDRSIRFYRGDEKDVYSRYSRYLESLSEQPDYFVRVCADNPLLEPEFIDHMIAYGMETPGSRPDYVSFIDAAGTPSILTHFGLFAELVRTEAFLDAARHLKSDYDREHVTPVLRHHSRYKTVYIPMPEEIAASQFRLTVDTREDLNIVQDLFSGTDMSSVGWRGIISLLEANQDLVLAMKQRMDDNSKE